MHSWCTEGGDRAGLMERLLEGVENQGWEFLSWQEICVVFMSTSPKLT